MPKVVTSKKLAKFSKKALAADAGNGGIDEQLQKRIK